MGILGNGQSQREGKEGTREVSKEGGMERGRGRGRMIRRRCESLGELGRRVEEVA